MALKGITWKGYTVGFICVILISVFYSFSFLIWLPTYPLLAMEDTSQDNVWPYAFHSAIWAVAPAVLIIAAINKIKPVLSREDTTIVLIMCLIAGLQDANCKWSYNAWTVFTFVPAALANPAVFSKAQISLFKQYLSPVMFPNWDYYTPVAGNSVGVSWGIVLPNVLFVVVFMSCIYVMITFWLLLLRRMFVDVEQLPFPSSTLTMTLVEFTQPSKERKRPLSSKMFLAGLTISFLWVFLTGINYAYPPTGTMYDWGQSKPGWGYLYGTETLISPDISLSQYFTRAGLWTVLFLSVRDFYIGWCGLLSINVLISIIIGFVFFWLVFPSFFSGVWGLGDQKGMDPWTRVAGNSEESWPWENGVSVNLYAVAFGLFLGILIWTIITNRDSFAIMIKGLLKEPSEEDDPNKPLQYRTMWLVFLATLAATFILSVVINMDLPVFAVYIFLLLIFMIGQVRYYGESGGQMGSDMEPAITIQPITWVSILTVAIFGIQYFIGPGGEQYYNTINIMTLGIMGAIFFKSFILQSTMHTTVTMDSTKIGKTFNIKLKDIILKVIIPATVVAGIVQTITRTFLVHWLPWGKFTVFSWVHEDTAPWRNSFEMIKEGSPSIGCYVTNGFMSTSQIVGAMQMYPLDYAWKIVFGLVLALSLYFLQRRFGWLSISVAGLLLGLTMGWMFLFPAIIVLIVRVLVVRLYGSETYDSKVTPLMVGLIIGSHLAWFILMPLHDLFYILFTEWLRVGPW